MSAPTHPNDNEMVTAQIPARTLKMGTFGQSFPVSLRVRVQNHWESMPKCAQVPNHPHQP